MNLAQIKAKLDIAQFDLNTANDKDEKPTDWLRHWDNDKRVAVSIHKDLFAELKTQGNAISSLALQTEIKSGLQGNYTAHRIVKYTEAEHTL